MSFQGLWRAPSWRSRAARTTSRPSLYQPCMIMCEAAMYSMPVHTS